MTFQIYESGTRPSLKLSNIFRLRAIILVYRAIYKICSKLTFRKRACISQTRYKIHHLKMRSMPNLQRLWSPASWILKLKNIQESIQSSDILRNCQRNLSKKFVIVKKSRRLFYVQDFRKNSISRMPWDSYIQEAFEMQHNFDTHICHWNSFDERPKTPRRNPWVPTGTRETVEL